MEDSFTPISPERVRTETPLAPFLLQTEGLITDLLAQALEKKITHVLLEQRREWKRGFIRKTLLRANGLPLYLAVTFLEETPRTRALCRTLRREPDLLLGYALKKHRLFHHKSPPSIRRVSLLPKYRDLFEVHDGPSETWERTYAIFPPRGEKRVAGITEIFSPKLEQILAEQQGTQQQPETRTPEMKHAAQ